jgi:hypothetical protein
MKERKLPKTRSIAKLAEFWDTHDLTDFEDQLVETRAFEKEVQLHGKSKKFRRFLQGRSKQPATRSLDDYRRSLG